MKNKTIFSILFLLFSFALFGQTTDLEESLRKQSADTTDGWKKGGLVSLNLTQASFTNWAAGGENSVSVLGILSLYANLKKGNNIWENSLDIGYGLMKQASYNKFRKTDDKLEFNSKYGLKASKNWYYSALVNFRTQFSPGYNYPDDSTKISNFLAPAYLLAGIGMDYAPDLANFGAFGVDAAEFDDLGNMVTPGKKTKTEFGAYIRGIYKVDIMKNIFFQTKLELFSNYLENPQNIDVNWENLISMTVNKWISVDFTTQLIYDDDIMIMVDSNDDGVFDSAGPRTQFKETLMVGVSYKF